MAKERESSADRDAAREPAAANGGSSVPAESFETSLAKLEAIVRQLEEGQLGLSDSLARYEEGIRCLKQCHVALESAERKVELLTGVDADGNPVTAPFDDPSLSLEEKAEARSRRRSRAESTAGRPRTAERTSAERTTVERTATERASSERAVADEADDESADGGGEKRGRLF